MAFLLKETFATIHLKLTSGTCIKLLPSVGSRDELVFSYTSQDIDVAFNVPATANNYCVLSNDIELGRYSQALHHAAHISAVSTYIRVAGKAKKFGLIA